MEKRAKTVDEAVNEALKELNATIDEVDVTVLDAGSKGFLGIGSKPAVVKVELQFNPERIARNFLREVIAAFGISLNIDTTLKDKQLFINITGKDVGVLIGKHGQTLDSLQYLVNLVVNRGHAPYIAINLDTENYRKRRKETLESLAHNLAKKAKTTRKSVYLEPMTPYERRIIHTALQHDKYVTTSSEGNEPNRYVVIHAK